MGLDQYLYKHDKGVDIADHDQWPGAEIDWSLEDAADTYDAAKLAAGQVAYWRKANQVHHWFVQNIGGGVDDCQRMPVEAEQLAGLLATCDRIKALHDMGAAWEDYAEANLPTERGFFFGSAEYNSYYLEDIDQTIEQLQVVLAKIDPINDRFYYQASW